MKAVLSCLVGVVIGAVFVGCTSTSADVPEVFHWKCDSEYINRTTYILTDTETGKQYIVVRAGYGVAITPRLER